MALLFVSEKTHKKIKKEAVDKDMTMKELAEIKLQS